MTIPEGETVAHDVFISYATGDKAVADAVCAQLESVHRIRCWIAPRDITPGASWAESIIDALDTAKIMVLIFSSSANASMQIEREVERAVHKGINIIPLRIEDTAPTKTLEYFISAPHWLDALTVPLEEHIAKLAVSVKALLARPGAGTRVAAGPSPAAAAALAQVEPVRAAGSSRAQGWLVPAAAGVLVTAALALVAYRFLPHRAVPTSQTSIVAPSAATQPAPPAAPPVPARLPPEPATVVSVPTEPSAPKPRAATVATATAKPNLFIDFRNPLSEGTLVVSIDGQKKWSAVLAPDKETFAQSLVVPVGNHKVSVELLHPDGKARETQALDVTVDAAQPRTLRIRLSRFKRNLQVTSVVGLPEADTRAAQLKSK